MVSNNIKKNTILKKDLPSPIADSINLSYDVRYRVVSEDKNRLSHWSPINTISVSNTGTETGFDPNNAILTSIPNNVDIQKSKHLASISWTMPSLLITNPTEAEKELQLLQASIKEFDVYVQWKTLSVWSDWIWAGTSQGTNFSMAYFAGSGAPDHIKFRVQKTTAVKQAFNSATYLITDEEEL